MAFGYAGVLTEEDTVVWKTEGLTDALAIVSLKLPKGHTACTNGCGAGERPTKDKDWFLQKFKGKEVFVIHDCDNPGQAGAIGDREKNRPGWAPAIATYAKVVRNVVLPYDIQESHGKDVRDWIAEQKEAGKSNAEIYSELIEFSRQAEVIRPWSSSSENSDDFEAATSEQSTDAEDESAPKTQIKISIDDPSDLGKKNLAHYRSQGRDIAFYRSEFYTYKGSYYEQQSNKYISARVRGFIEREFQSHCEEETERWEKRVDDGAYDSDAEAEKARPTKLKVSSNLVRNVVEAIQEQTVIPDHVEMGTLLSDRLSRNYWPTLGCLLDLDTVHLDPDAAQIPHTSDYFSDDFHDYHFDLTASCPVWQKFLESVFRDKESGKLDLESIDTLQRWFGYCLMRSANLGKLLCLDGVSRSGKGVIARILKAIMGDKLVASPRLREFAGDFALEPLIGKRLAVIGDAKLSRRQDRDSILEVLLGLTGEDSLDANQKNKKSASSVKFDVRIMMLCNGLPQFDDSAMAIANRIVVIKFRNSFVGQEDQYLTAKLLNELDGIFAWALQGYEKMKVNFRLPQPESGKQAVEDFRKAIAPVRQFVVDFCHLKSDDKENSGELWVHKSAAFQAWTIFCNRNGIRRIGTQANFLRELGDAYPEVQEYRPGESEDPSRRRRLKNIDLRKIAKDALRKNKAKLQQGNQSQLGGKSGQSVPANGDQNGDLAP